MAARRGPNIRVAAMVVHAPYVLHGRMMHGRVEVGVRSGRLYMWDDLREAEKDDVDDTLRAGGIDPIALFSALSSTVTWCAPHDSVVIDIDNIRNFAGTKKGG